MNAVEAVLRAVSDDLAELGLSWAVVGGFAVSARAQPRFTQDVDVAIAVVDDAGAESAVRRLADRGYHVSALVEQDSVGRLAMARLVPTRSGASIVVDALMGSADTTDLALAEQAVDLISARGYARGRDLRGALTSLVER